VQEEEVRSCPWVVPRDKMERKQWKQSESSQHKDLLAIAQQRKWMEQGTLARFRAWRSSV